MCLEEEEGGVKKVNWEELRLRECQSGMAGRPSNLILVGVLPCLLILIRSLPFDCPKQFLLFPTLTVTVTVNAAHATSILLSSFYTFALFASQIFQLKPLSLSLSPRFLRSLNHHLFFSLSLSAFVILGAQGYILKDIN
ncbi:hypothetical protein LWI28_023713 [Acer negundo]|uniref:Uncharacterized protein n=1 Tax=Acer negundo TaxID=4023 RepID=A0AAD5NS75_ACENE|nr:hypothetical protein LWI28_023713 [Acer negundo]